MHKQVIGMLLMVTAIAGWWQIKQHGAEWMPVQHVRVEGSFQHLKRNAVKTALMPVVETGFYQVDLAQVRQTLERLPWVEKASVQRVWPDALKIVVEEQQPVARWRNNALINNKGELFRPDNLAEFGDLPEIIGPPGQHALLLDKMKELRKLLADKGMLLQRFYVNERRAWQVRLVSGMEMKLGRLTPVLQLKRFLKTVDVLGQALLELMMVVDLRYPNGYAVTWKSDDWKDIIEKKKRV
jgi:cell division protein FtsQ